MSEAVVPKIQSASLPYHHGDLRRALIDSALALLTEEQDWDFSLREVARRAGVSHNAPYNHFPEKRDLLDAVAAVGFERLRETLLSTISGADDMAAALAMSGGAYVRLGIGNPALYRLMFGTALAIAGDEHQTMLARAAGAEARAVLQGVVRRGARAGTFAIAAEDEGAIALATLSAWSAVHGLTMLIIDGVAGPGFATEEMIERIIGIEIAGLRSFSARSRRPIRAWKRTGDLR
jgi:AcrR family transcriptional regulator